LLSWLPFGVDVVLQLAPTSAQEQIYKVQIFQASTQVSRQGRKSGAIAPVSAAFVHSVRWPHLPREAPGTITIAEISQGKCDPAVGLP
jgi:hypothetical protein